MIKKTDYQTIIKYLLLALIICSTALGLIKPVIRLPHQIFIDNNEGWMAYFSVYAISQTPLYQPLDSFILNNYPPLSFYVCGVVGTLLGDIISAGRAIALLGLFLTAVMISLIILRFSGSVYLSLTAGILFVGYMSIHHTDYVAMNDPQWIAHGLMMSGLALFLYKKENRVLFYCSILIMLFAGLIKHSLLPVPAAITVWLYMNDKRRFYHWILAGGLLTAVALFVLYVAYGGDFFVNILMAPRTYRIGRIANTGLWLMPSIIYISAAFIVYTMFLKDRDIRLILLFSVVSLAWGAFVSGGGGVYYNAIFDFIISLFIAAFIAADRLPGKFEKKTERGGISTIIAIFILFLPVLLAAPYEFHFTKEFLKNLPQIEKQTQEDIAFVANYPEPVMCENPALCYWAGKRFSFDFYSTGAKLKTGTMPKQIVADKLDNKEFSLIQINDEEGESHFLTEDAIEKIFENYSTIRRSKESGLFLVRRNSNESK